jgi:hypothetical protein
MPMRANVFAEVTFWLLIAFSLVIPAGIYWILLVKRAVSRGTVLLLGFTLVAIAGLDVYLLQHLARLAKVTPSLADDAAFVSEVSLALYLLPAMYAGIGVNVLSHVLIRHLGESESRFLEERRAAAAPAGGPLETSG